MSTYFNSYRDDMIEDLSFRLGIDPKNVGKFLDYLRDYLIDALIEKGKVRFTGVGDFLTYEEIKPTVKKKGFIIRPHNSINIVFYPSITFLECVIKHSKSVNYSSKKSKQIYVPKKIIDGRTPQVYIPCLDQKNQKTLALKNLKSVKINNHLKRVMHSCYQNKDLIKQAMFKYREREEKIEEFLNDDDEILDDVMLEEIDNKSLEETDNQDLANEIDSELDEEEIEELFGENT